MATKSIELVFQLILQQNRKKAENCKTDQKADTKKKQNWKYFSSSSTSFKVNLVGVIGSMVLLICWRVVPACNVITLKW